MKKLNVYMFHYGPSELPEFVKLMKANKHVNLVLGPTNEDHIKLLNVPFYRKAYDKKIYAFMSDYWRMWIIKKEGPGLYMDTSFKMHDVKAFNCFLESISNKNVFFKEKPNKIASCIYYVRDQNIVNDYLEYYDNYADGNIRKLAISPTVLTKALEQKVEFKGYEEINSKDSIYYKMTSVLGGKFGIEKRGGASWNAMAPKWWKDRTGLKYWAKIKFKWLNNTF